MSGASPSRAAVFTSSPQAVEIYERGAWWPGSMLGWRHDKRGRCQAWVRVEFAGVVEDAWVELTLLRLPESPADRHLVLAREPKGASEVTRTQHLPLVREGGATAAGRAVPPAGGRRRAPETGEQPTPAAAPAGLPTSGDRPLGRHRAPAAADAGRHRAADTAMPDTRMPDTTMPSATPADPAPASGRTADRWSPPPPRTELPPAGPVVRRAVRGRADSDLFTRPLRLDEGVGSARRSRRDSLSV